MYQAGIYCRVSVKEISENNRYSNSIYSQIAMGEDYIKEHAEIEKRRIYIDDGVSGGHFRRSGFQEMIQDMKDGVINMVIVKDISRLGREQIETSRYVEKYFPEWKIRLVSLLDGYDSKTCIYDEMIEIKTLFHDMYLRDTSKKIKASIREKRQKGEYTPKMFPFGYVKSEKIKNHLEIDEYAATVVQKIFQLYLCGMGSTKIVKVLNQEKIPSPAKYKKEILKMEYPWKTGEGLWTVSAVNEILTNPVYTGALVLQKTEKLSYKTEKRRKIPLKEQKLIRNIHEAIVSIEDFKKVQDIRKRHGSRRNILES